MKSWVPGASLLTLAILVLGIIQIGPFIIVAPLVVWSWTTMTTGPALAFTACMATVIFIDSFLKPFVLAHGLTTPTLVTLIGVIGGVLAYGIAGLFVGPVVLAVAWDLANAWIRDSEGAVGWRRSIGVRFHHAEWADGLGHPFSFPEVYEFLAVSNLRTINPQTEPTDIEIRPVFEMDDFAASDPSIETGQVHSSSFNLIVHEEPQIKT
jgi:hypothetical protein